MGVGLETIFDLGNDNEQTNLSDLEKWKNFLTENGIKHEIFDGEDQIRIVIHEDHIDNSSYRNGPALDLIFDTNHRFKYFEPWGS